MKPNGEEIEMYERKKKSIRKLQRQEMTTKSCARKRKFRAPRHTESLLTCDFVVGLCARIFLSFLCRNLVNSVSDLPKIAGIAGGPENSRAHLSLTR